MSESKQVPLLELLESVPANAHAWTEKTEPNGWSSSTNHPYGRYCHEAAARIRELERPVNPGQTQLYQIIPDELAGPWQENDRRGYISVDLHRFRPVLDEAPGIRKALSKAIDFAEWGCTIIANAGGGDWEKESKEWQEAAARYRDQFHDEIRFLAGVPMPEPEPVKTQAGQLWRDLRELAQQIIELDGVSDIYLRCKDIALQIVEKLREQRPVPAQACACEGTRMLLQKYIDMQNAWAGKLIGLVDFEALKTEFESALAQSCPCQQSGEQPENLSGGKHERERERQQSSMVHRTEPVTVAQSPPAAASELEQAEIVFVEWHDSASTSGWTVGADKSGHSVIQSVGILVGQSDEAIIISTSRSSSGSYTDQLTIPKCCITAIHGADFQKPGKKPNPPAAASEAGFEKFKREMWPVLDGDGEDKIKSAWQAALAYARATEAKP